MRSELDPQVAAEVAALEALAVPPWHRLSVDAARRVEADLFTPADPPHVDVVRDLAFDGPAGPVPVRAYRHDADDGDAGVPPGDGRPTLVFYHGGGWVLGTLDSAGDVCRLLARRAGALVLSVDYRLAPEHPFPAAVDDAYAALEWAAAVAPELGGDDGWLQVCGTSAGGTLAAATALRARAFDGPDLARQVLLYPMLDRDTDRDSYADNADGPLLTPADVAWFWDRYLRSPVDAHSPFAAPLRASDLRGLPPTTIVTAGHDPLRDEGVAYAEALDDAGVPVDHRHRPSMVHGFLSLTDAVDAADAAMDEVAAAVAGRP